MTKLSRTAKGLASMSLVLALAGCSLSSSGPETGEAPENVDSNTNESVTQASSENLHLRMITDPSGFDPAKARAADDYYVARLLYDTLIRRGDDGALVPGLASNWEAKSASEYKFNIREGATCADGTEITADIVATSLKRLADPETGSNVRTLIFGSAGDPTIEADAAEGSVTVTLAADWSDFTAGISSPHAGVVCPAGIADPEGMLSGEVEGAFSGPYNLAEAVPGVSYTFEFREGYNAWPDFTPALDGKPASKLILTPATDQTTIANKLLAGEFDSANLIDANATRLEDKEGFETRRVASSTLYLIFNQREGSAGADESIRAAVAQAIDNVAFTEAITQGRGTPLTTIDSPALACTVDEPGLMPAYDPAAAAKTLEGVTLRLAGTTSLGTSNEYIAEVLRKAGANVELESLDGATWASRTSSGSSWDLTVQGSVNLIGTLPNSLMRVMGPLTEDGGRNSGGAINEEGYGALQRAMGETDLNLQCEALKDAQRSLLKRVDIVPLSTLPATIVVRDGASVRNFGDYLDPATFRVTD